MEVISLSWWPHRPSLLLKFPNATILLDCAIDMNSIASFLPYSVINSSSAIWVKNAASVHPKKSVPQTQDLVRIGDCFFVDALPEFQTVSLEEISKISIDVILVSNWMSLMALPFITEKTNFQGAIYATDPIVQFGRLVIEEFLDMMERVDRAPSDGQWKANEIHGSFANRPSTDPTTWRQFYSKAEMENSLSKIINVYFRETMVINGIIKVTAHSSGFSIGSANWTIQTESDRIGYLASTSSRASHVKPHNLDHFHNVDTLMLTSLARQPDSSPSSMASKFTSTVADTLKKQGNVLIPISPTGVIYDLIELVINTIERHSLSRDIPIYFISVVAESTFAFANIYSEWLSQVKSEKAYVPEDPFPLVELVKSGRIKIYENLHGAFSRECRTPCVVFTGHPSLRIGDVVHFLEIWGKDPRSAVIMTDPDFPLDPFYDPYKSLAIRAYFYPIDTRLDYNQVYSSILPDLTPKCLMMHESYARPLIYPDNKKLVISHPNLITFGANRTKLSLPYNQRRKRVIIESELLSEMKLQCCGENSEIGMSSLGAMLSAYDNDLKILPPMGSKRPKLLIDQRLGGKVAPGRLIKALADRRIKADLLHSKSFESSSSVLIKIPVFNAEVKINDQDHKAKIFCPTPAHREIIQAAIKECLADV